MNNTLDVLEIIGRRKSLFQTDLKQYEEELSRIVSSSSFLVLGGAGSIGQAVVKEIFKRNAKRLHVVDISENNLVEIVRDMRSSLGYINGDFSTYALDIGSWQFQAYLDSCPKFDYVLNLTALKHVRSEKDPFTLMRMVETNIINTIATVRWAQEMGVKKYFAVSTDKAANPVNMMGASKRIMELFLARECNKIPISTARFANVAFSDGSLLHGFTQRLNKRQPIVAPNDVKRYFVTSEESGLICLFSVLLGKNREIFFPKLEDEALTLFTEIACKFLKKNNLEPVLVKTEDEARKSLESLAERGKWPCYFSPSDTTGEKPYEEFYTGDELLDVDSFDELGIVINGLPQVNESDLDNFLEEIYSFKKKGVWTKNIILSSFKKVLPNFNHEEKGKSLDTKM